MGRGPHGLTESVYLGHRPTQALPPNNARTRRLPWPLQQTSRLLLLLLPRGWICLVSRLPGAAALPVPLDMR
eukprot:13789511-Alexandrium_andersonii.AAC.1